MYQNALNFIEDILNNLDLYLVLGDEIYKNIETNLQIIQELVDKATPKKAIEEKGLMERRYYYPVCKRK